LTASEYQIEVQIPPLGMGSAGDLATHLGEAFDSSFRFDVRSRTQLREAFDATRALRRSLETDYSKALERFHREFEEEYRRQLTPRYREIHALLLDLASVSDDEGVKIQIEGLLLQFAKLTERVKPPLEIPVESFASDQRWFSAFILLIPSPTSNMPCWWLMRSSRLPYLRQSPAATFAATPENSWSMAVLIRCSAVGSKARNSAIQRTQSSERVAGTLRISLSSIANKHI
jgi:hypothetical protein